MISTMTDGNISSELYLRVGDDSHIPNITVVILVLLILIFSIISVIGNAFICLIVYRKRSMRSAINLLLINIAFSDIIMALIVMPYMLSELFDVDNNQGICASMSVLKDATLCSASYTLLLISVDRYMIIVHRKDRLCPKLAKIAIVIIWSCSLLITSPQFLSFFRSDLQTFDEALCNLSYDDTYNNYTSAYKLLLTALIFFGPMTIMCYTYASILRTVQLALKKVHDHAGSTTSVSVTQYSSKLGLPPVATPYRFTGDFSTKRKAFGTILILFITQMCCWCPSVTSRIVYWQPRSMSIRLSLLALGLAKSALYPIIFSVRNKKFRMTCLQYLPARNLIKLPRAMIYRQRINPKAVYECPDIVRY